MTATMKAALRSGDQVFVARAGFPGAPIGTRITVASVTNEGTKRNPAWRFYGNGLWFYESDVSKENPL